LRAALIRALIVASGNVKPTKRFNQIVFGHQPTLFANERAQQFKTPATNVTDSSRRNSCLQRRSDRQSDRSWSIEQPLPITQDVSLNVPEIKEITEPLQGSLQA
jgi:hypothetical protein